jgi:phage terminase large subunit-like protein
LIEQIGEIQDLVNKASPPTKTDPDLLRKIDPADAHTHAVAQCTNYAQRDAGTWKYNAWAFREGIFGRKVYGRRRGYS